MSLHNKNIGKIGEEIALQYLLQKGYILLKQNFTTHWGELDLILKKGNTVVFVEVKTRVGALKGKPYEAVNIQKLSHLKRPIQFFLLDKQYKDYKYSLDVISITLNAQLLQEDFKHFQNVDF